MALHGLILLFCEINRVVAAALSRARHRLMNGDFRQPRREPGSAVELAQMKVGVDIRLLHDVFRLVLVPDDRASGTIDPLVMAPHQDFVEGGLPFENPRNDVFVAEGGPPVEHCSTYHMHAYLESQRAER